MKQLMIVAATCAAVFTSSCVGVACNESTDGNVAMGSVRADSSTAIAETEYGRIAGYTEQGIYIYKGVPYAKADRFMPPTAPDAWKGLRSCRAYGPTAPQGKRLGWYSDEQAFAFHWDDGFANEDCQRLNIWTQASKNDGKKRPVMVWLHGGGYSAGSGQELPSYDGTNLALKGDVVVVTINHRLNVLGFLDLSAYGEKYAHSGNVGLLDIVAALRWVNHNIEQFGGDKDNVTIFGQSGGGGKVSTLLATPSAKGLFHKAIVQSGSMIRTMTQKYSRRIADAVMNNLGLQSSQIDSLQHVPYETLLAAGDKALTEIRKEADRDGFASFIFGWAPTVDGDVLPSQPFDPAAPEQSRDIPMMIGTTQHEFTISAYVPQVRTLSKDQIVSRLREKYDNRTNEFLDAFGKAYPKYKPIDLLDVDFIFRPSAVEQANIKAAQGGAPVYMYLFAWESPVLDGMFRSTHCMEIPFVFNNTQRHSTMTGGGKEAQKLADLMSGAWLNFARTGNPNVSGLPQWDAYTTDKGATMVFNNKCEVKYNHDKELLRIVRAFPVRGF